MRQTPFRDLVPRLARTVGLGAALLMAALQVHAQEARFEVSGQAVTPPLMPMTATLSIAGSGVGLLAGAATALTIVPLVLRLRRPLARIEREIEQEQARL